MEIKLSLQGRPLHRNSIGKGYLTFTIVNYVGNDRLTDYCCETDI